MRKAGKVALILSLLFIIFLFFATHLFLLVLKPFPAPPNSSGMYRIYHDEMFPYIKFSYVTNSDMKITAQFYDNYSKSRGWRLIPLSTYGNYNISTCEEIVSPDYQAYLEEIRDNPSRSYGVFYTTCRIKARFFGLIPISVELRISPNGGEARFY